MSRAGGLWPQLTSPAHTSASNALASARRVQELVHQPEHLDHRRLAVGDDGSFQQIPDKRVEGGFVPSGVVAPGFERSFIQSKRDVLHSHIVRVHIGRVPRTSCVAALFDGIDVRSELMQRLEAPSPTCARPIRPASSPGAVSRRCWIPLPVPAPWTLSPSTNSEFLFLIVQRRRLRSSTEPAEESRRDGSSRGTLQYRRCTTAAFSR